MNSKIHVAAKIGPSYGLDSIPWWSAAINSAGSPNCIAFHLLFMGPFSPNRAFQRGKRIFRRGKDMFESWMPVHLHL